MYGQSFVYGAAILLIASLFNRSVGFVYQILIMRLIKPEGVGLFSMVFPIYVSFLVLATMGIPVAISKLVAHEVARDNLKGAYDIFKISLVLLVVSGFFFTVLLLFAAPLLMKHLFPNPDVYLCFVCLVPGIFIVSVCSAFRGFFQGMQSMSPTAITQSIEQFTRVSTGLLAAWLLLPRGFAFAAVGISLGVICGEVAGLSIMIFIYATRRPRCTASSPYRQVVNPLGRIFSLGVPVTLTRFASTALMSLDALIIPRRLLTSGMNIHDATGIYGQFVGISEALLFTPGVITVSLATALIPAISDALARDRLKLVQTRIGGAVRITLLVGALVAAVFLVLPHDLCRILFGYAQAGTPLQYLALGAPFLYLQQTTTGILQGLGRADVPFKNLLQSSVFKVLGIYYLTSLPGFGILGTALSLSFAYMIMALLNLRDASRITGFRLDAARYIFKPLISAAVSAFTMWQMKPFLNCIALPDLVYLALLLLTGSLVYLAALLLTGGIRLEDLHKLRSILNR